MNNFNNNEINIKTNKKVNEMFSNIYSNLNNANLYENEKNYYCDNNPQDNYIVPIEFNHIDYTTYLSMGQHMKLCLNLFKEEEVLIKEKEDLIKKKKENHIDLKNSEKILETEKKDLNELEQKIKENEINIENTKKLIREKKSVLEKLSVKNKKYEEYLKFLKNNPQSSTNRAG